MVENNNSHLPEGLVYLKNIDPSIKVNLRYYSDENFIGKRIEGYNKNTAILTNDTANALSKVQKKLSEDGFELVIYDAYRPQIAVDSFYKWSQDDNTYEKQQQYYPYVDKSTLFNIGYIAKKSAHSRGSTVDLSIIEIGKEISEVEEIKRKLKDNREILFLDDNSFDMGSSFDLFDEASHYDNDLIDDIYKDRRMYLKTIMESEGFESYRKEWWHFSFRDELFKDNYFDFLVE